jgi:uncharacterized protein
MILDEIKTRMWKAMKEGRSVEKEILKVAIGEITTQAAREGQTGSDEETRAIVRKLIKSNQESIKVLTDPERAAVLVEENRILAEFLPKSLSVGDIVAALGPVEAAVRAANNDGQATGIAMKHLKAEGAVVDGRDVSLAVRQLRGA